MGDLRSTNDRVSEVELHELLWRARQEFPDLSLLVEMTERTRPLLESLASRGVVTWEPVPGAYSDDARVLRVVPFVDGQPGNEEL